MSLNYEMVSAVAVDPIEKSLYALLSWLAHPVDWDCRMQPVCGFCQNYELSTGRTATRRMSSDQVVQLARRKLNGGEHRNRVYIFGADGVVRIRDGDGAEGERRRTQERFGHQWRVQPDPLEELLQVIGAMNIDVKAFSQRFYTKTCSGPLKPVLETVERAAGKCHVEVTNLPIPTLNDSDEVRLARVLAGGTRRHDSAAHLKILPNHRMSLPPTPVATMLRAYGIAKQSLKYVYLGNIGDEGYSTTFCHECGAAVVVRSPFRLGVKVCLDGRKCAKCRAEQPIVT